MSTPTSCKNFDKIIFTPNSIRAKHVFKMDLKSGLVCNKVENIPLKIKNLQANSEKNLIWREQYTSFNCN